MTFSNIIRQKVRQSTSLCVKMTYIELVDKKIVQSLDYLIRTTIHKKDAQKLTTLALHYGERLEKLNNEGRLGLIAALSRYLYVQSIVEEYSIIDAITDTFINLDENICKVLSKLDGLSSQNINLLIEMAKIGQGIASLTDQS